MKELPRFGDKYILFSTNFLNFNKDFLIEVMVASTKTHIYWGFLNPDKS